MSNHPALRNLRRALTLLAALLAVTAFTFAAAAKPAPKAAVWPPPVPAEELDMQRQVREIALTLRAPCCPTLTVAQHDSPVTLEMKREIREMIVQGKSRRQIVNALVAKYGKGILPPAVAASDLAIYGGLAALAIVLIWAVASHIRGRRMPEVLHLGDDRWGKDTKRAA
jgi:cytochrome c-type biogenesis protein CcmH/NrfF